MKRILTATLLVFIAAAYLQADDAQPKDPLRTSITKYFEGMFAKLELAADKNPQKKTFRKIMKPLVKDIDGMYGATLISTNFVIKQVYYSRNFLARGYDLKKVKELKTFYKQMQEKPAPQLSEPGHGSIMQPALVAMRYPVIKDGIFTNIVSMMIRTESFIEAVGLDKYNAYEIICDGKSAEKEGKLSEKPESIKVKLPSTEWVIKYN